MKIFLKWRVPAFVLVTTVLLFRFVFFVGYVPTESMEPTIHKGSYILGCRIFGELKVGDIIVFEHEGKQLVKRIAAVGGDVVEHKGDVLIVPDGKNYVLGDNKDNSADSKSWAVPLIENDDIIATVVGIG
ncbi:MAG: signal peptidase I [Acutalibacter sp.]|uniref:signal peptidase I n=1 Tax=Acutalibacter sp. TaxID=1918636 RepID=UPI002172DCA8|nr:signal peptidase I [Acutalibacter sp.]MCI9226017.1 signal peptidase I [Acutalibacter sp.]